MEDSSTKYCFGQSRENNSAQIEHYDWIQGPEHQHVSRQRPRLVKPIPKTKVLSSRNDSGVIFRQPNILCPVTPMTLPPNLFNEEPRALVTFRPMTETHRWHTTQPAQELHLLKAITCGIGALCFTAALVVIGAEAGGGGFTGYFWALTIVISSTILLSLPYKKGSANSLLKKVIGILVLLLGYWTMHTAIKTQEDRELVGRVTADPKVIRLQNNVDDLLSRVQPFREKIKSTDPILYRTRFTQLIEESKPLEAKLEEARLNLESAQISAKASAKQGLSKDLSSIEMLRRLMLEPLNILCLHGFLQTLPNILAGFARAFNSMRLRRSKMKLQVNFIR
jgi:hypothetical protein